MTQDAPEIRMIPVDAITVLNPRVRNKRIFQELVTSIAHLGLKKPITVSQRPGKPRFDLVCGQGRLEAFIALGQPEIPAIVIDASEDDCFVMSLVENLARRQHTPLELVRAIGSLRERGYTHHEIAAKVDFSPEYVGAICYLLENGEEKLINAVERGVIPHSIAMEIAKAKEGEVTCDLFAFLTTDANAEVGALHPTAMPVILTSDEEIETWLTAPAAEALALQRPLADGALKVVARGPRQDNCPIVVA